MILYYDIFRHPMRAGELERLCGGDPGQALASLIAEGQIVEAEGFFLRPGQGGRVLERQKRSREAERCWPQAIRAARLLARLPAVEGVLITGALSKQSAAPDGDIDFMLLIRPGQVWTSKSLLQVVRRVLPSQMREQFCTNYLLDTDHLQIPEQNLFTAMELVTAIPMVGPAACVRLLEQNAWAGRLLPGWRWSLERARHAEPLPARLEPGTLSGAALSRLEPLMLEAWDRYWNRKYRWLPAEIRAERFKRRPEVATNHLHDFQRYVLSEYRTRCRMAGVEP